VRKPMLIFGMVLAGLVLLVGTAGAFDDPPFEVDLYGYFKLDGAYDQNLTSHGNFVMWVEPPSYENDDEQFNMTVNQSRFGFDFSGRNIRPVDVGGNLEFDLYANATATGPEQSTAMLQLRHAYFTVNWGSWKLLAGQTWDLISPLSPPTLNYSSLWGCGNIGYLRPQLSVHYAILSEVSSRVTFSGGFFRTIGNDLTPTFSLALNEESEGEDDGIDAGIPSFQARLDINHEMGNRSSFRAGVAGLWGQLKAETNLGNSEKYNNWAFTGYLSAEWQDLYGFSTEIYAGSNLGYYFGGILSSSTIDGVASTGWWGNAWYMPHDKIRFNIGYGQDEVADEDIAAGRANNWCTYGNFNYYIVPQVAVGVELSYWETEYKLDAVRRGTVDNIRAQTSFTLNF